MKMKFGTKLMGCVLAMFLLFSCVIFPSYFGKAYAEPDAPKADDPSNYEDFDEYLTGYDLSDEYIEEVDSQVVEKYERFIYVDEMEHIQMSTTEIEEKYGDNIKENMEASDFVEDESEFFDVAAVRMIRRNLKKMNELVDQDLGEITEDYEFVFYETDEYVEQWRMWNFKLTWYKVGAFFDSDVAILFSILLITPAILAEGINLSKTVSDIKNNEELIKFVIDEALLYLPTEIWAYIVSALSSELMGYIISACEWGLKILEASDKVWAVIKILYDILMPSVSDCALVLYNAAVRDRGVEIKLCWIPTWWDKWGLTFRSI